MLLYHFGARFTIYLLFNGKPSSPSSTASARGLSFRSAAAMKYLLRCFIGLCFGKRKGQVVDSQEKDSLLTTAPSLHVSLSPLFNLFRLQYQ